MSAKAEIEAKLQLKDAGDVERLARVRRLGPYRVAGRERARLYTEYVDTQEFALLRAGVALRVRRDGRRFEATAKWMGAVRGAVHERPELQVSLPRRPRGRFVLPRGPLHEQLAAIVAGRALVPILITDIERTRAELYASLAGRAPFAELALDRVRVRSPRAPRQVASEYGELEIELRHGTRKALAALSRTLERELGLEPATDTKFSRGLSLLYGRELLERTDPGLPQAGDDLVQAARKLLCFQLSRIRANDPGTRRGDPEALHRMRVAVRRCRAALRAFGAGVPERRRAELIGELSWLGDALGSVRDLDVQLGAHAESARSQRGASLRALERLCAHLRAERARRHAELARVLESRRYFAVLVAVEEFASGRARGARGARARRPFARAAARALERALATVYERGRKLEARKRPPDDEALHALRRRARRARYLLEFTGELTGKPGRRMLARLTELQDLLGEHQDAVVAARSIAAYRDRVRGRAGAETRLALDALVAREQSRAERARARFRDGYRALARGEKDVRKAIERLRAAAPRRASRQVRR